MAVQAAAVAQSNTVSLHHDDGLTACSGLSLGGMQADLLLVELTGAGAVAQLYTCVEDC